MDSLIRTKRKELGIMQTGLARRLDVSRQTLDGWERRKVTPPMNKIELIARLLNLKFVDVAKDYISKEEVK